MVKFASFGSYLAHNGVVVIFRNLCQEDEKITNFDKKGGHGDTFQRGKEGLWSFNEQKSKFKGPKKVRRWLYTMAQW